MIYNTMEPIFDVAKDKTGKEQMKELFPEYTPLHRLTMRLQLHNIIQRANKKAIEFQVEQMEKDMIRIQHITFLRTRPFFIHSIL